MCVLVLLAADVVPAAEQSLLYVARAPRDRDGFRTLAPSIEVFDINNGHALVRVIPLDAPTGTTPVMHIRGITASAATNTLYVSHYGSYKDLRPGRPLSGYVLALDMETDQVLWNRAYPSSVDRGAVTPDGGQLFMPSGELAPTPFFYVIDGNGMINRIARRLPVGKVSAICPIGIHVSFRKANPCLLEIGILLKRFRIKIDG